MYKSAKNAKAQISVEKKFIKPRQQTSIQQTKTITTSLPHSNNSHHCSINVRNNGKSNLTLPSPPQTSIQKHSTKKPPTNTAQTRLFFNSIINKLKPAPKSAFDLPPIDLEAAMRPQESIFYQYDNNHSPSPQQHQQPHQTSTTTSTTTTSTHSTPSPKHSHKHGKDCNHNHSSTKEHNTPSQQHNIPPQHQTSRLGNHQMTTSFKKMTLLESDLGLLLCNVKHPETGNDIVQSEFVTQIKETSPGNIIVRVKLDKNFRIIKTLIEDIISTKYQIGDNTQNNPQKPKLSSLKISLAETQDDLASLEPVKAPAAVTAPPNPPRSTLKMTSVNNNTKSTPESSSLTTTGQVQSGGSGVRGLSAVKKVILVYSGKGGVGKSSVAVNLAAALSQLETLDNDSINMIQNDTATANERRKLQIGLFDADIFGPSLPSLIDVVSLSRGVITGNGLNITPTNTSTTIDLVEDYQDDKSALIRPIMANNIKLMSYGYVTRTKGGHGSGDAGPAPAIMRGGMVGPYLTELLTRTNWGNLDALVVDMPPGTSDIHITLTQQVKNASAVIVTTPSKLAYVDVVRGMQLLDQTNIPIVSLVQNMSYFIAPNDINKTKHYIFGGAGGDYKDKLVKLGSIPTDIEMPIIPTISDDAEQGIPLTMKHNDIMNQLLFNMKPQVEHKFSPTQETKAPLPNLTSPSLPTDPGLLTTLHNYAQLAHNVHYWSELGQRSTISRPDMNMEFNPTSNTMTIYVGTQIPGIIDPTKRFELNPLVVRKNCVCAACKHEFTGTQLSDPEKIPKNVKPTAIQPRGAYAVAIQWSDGHSGSIYTWDQLLNMEKL
jgi:Mrp family chromosome partitioning ATPase